MEMWNWLMECYKDGSLTLRSLEEVMRSDKAARQLWRDWSSDASDFIMDVRDEVKPFVEWIGQRERDKEGEA